MHLALNLRRATHRIALLACISAISLRCCHAQQKSSGSSSTQQKIASLQSLRDSGVISDEEYAQKVAALKAAAAGTRPTNAQKLLALKNLRDTGVLSDDEYRQKVAALNGSPASGQAHAQTPERHATGVNVSMTPTVAHLVEDRGWGLAWGTIKLPVGWGFDGRVVHGNGCVTSGDSPMWIAESPDKSTSIMYLPILKASWFSIPQVLDQMKQNGCPILRSTRAVDFLTQVVLPRMHKSFQVVGTAPEIAMAEMAEQGRRMIAQNPGMNNELMHSRSTIDTARVVLTYVEGGVTKVELASAELFCQELSSPGIGRMPGNDSLDCTSFDTVIVHVPDDGTPLSSLATKDYAKTNELSFYKIDPSPAWTDRLQQAMQQQQQQNTANANASSNASAAMAKDNADAAAKQAAIRRGSAQYAEQAHNNVYQNQQAANAQVNGAFAAHVGDYNVYTNNTTGQQYQLSNQYNNTYVNKDGSVALQTNSANTPGVDWTQMTPKY